MAKRLKPRTYQEPTGPNVIVRTLPKGKSSEAHHADLVTEGIAANVTVIKNLCAGVMPKPHLTELLASVELLGERVAAGDFRDVERMMAAQIVVMNAGFTSLMARATQSQPMEAFETYMRYGLRFQNQCRATAETLATMKMPPVFAKQANISNGPQQVNNTVGERPTVMVARVPRPLPVPSKLLEASQHGERLDGGTEGATAAGDPALEAVGVLDGARKSGGKRARLEECVQGRRTTKAPRIRARAQSATSAAR